MARNKEIKHCKQCNNTYESSSPCSMYCSQKCKRDSTRVLSKCIECGEESLVLPQGIVNGQRKCRKCTDHNTKSIIFNKTCEVCGTEFTTTRGNAKLCSTSCIYKYRERRVNKECSVCKCQYEVPEYRSESSKICTSSDCYSKYFLAIFDKHKEKRIASLKDKWENDDDYRQTMLDKAKAMSGELHYLYDASITDDERQISRNYPGYREWRTSVYIKDNFTCQCCDQYGGDLTAHHKKNYKDNEDSRTDIDNGITLCDTCHRAFHQIYGKSNNTEDQIVEFIQCNLQFAQ